MNRPTTPLDYAAADWLMEGLTYGFYLGLSIEQMIALMSPENIRQCADLIAQAERELPK